MNALFIILVLIIGGTFIAGAAAALLAGLRERGLRRVLWLLCASLILYGGVAFFGQALSATGGLSFLGPSFEWPMGYVRGVVRDSAGRYIAIHGPAGRIQVYDNQGRFVRGWFVRTCGGSAKLRVIDNDYVEVFTAVRQRRFLFSPDGTLLQEGTYAPKSYDDLPFGPAIAMTFDTPWALSPFTHPLIAWGMVFLGMLGLLALDRTKRKSRTSRPRQHRPQREKEPHPQA
jgi:hypothetical protein